jgi:hypothetical protein
MKQRIILLPFQLLLLLLNERWFIRLYLIGVLNNLTQEHQLQAQVEEEDRRLIRSGIGWLGRGSDLVR